MMKQQLSIDKSNNLSLWGVGMMSFCWSTASLMAFSILPTFLTDVLHASKTKIGLIEGVAIFTAFVFKVLSGAMSDYVKKRKPLIILGSFMSIIVKPMFAVAASIWWVFVARFIDRLSKGIRSSPTDALIADLSHDTDRGRSYGLRQSLYTFGAVFGACIATVVMLLSHDNYRLVFALSTIPATIALLILLTLIKAPPVAINPARPRWHIRQVAILPAAFWQILSVTAILMLARFSEAFVTLRAKELGWTVALLPLMIVVMDVVHASVAYPMGKLADRLSRPRILFWGMTFLVLGNILMIIANSVSGVVMGVIIVGLHMGTTQAILSALVADATPPDLRGTAFSLFYLVAGTSVLLGNYLAGYLSDIYGLVGAFYGGLLFSSLACIVLWFIGTRKNLSFRASAQGN